MYKIGEKVELTEYYIKNICKNLYIPIWYDKYGTVKPIIVGFNRSAIYLSFIEYINKEKYPLPVKKFFRKAFIDEDNNYNVDDKVHWNVDKNSKNIKRIEINQLELF